MNLCFISSYIPKPNAGGVDRVINNLADGFIARGIGVSCCYQYRDSEEGHISHLPCYQLPAKNPYLLKENVDFLVTLVTSNDIEILMFGAQHNVLWETCVEVSRITGVKLVYQLHGNPEAEIKIIKDRFKISRLTTQGIRRWREMLGNLIKLPYTYYSRRKYIAANYSKKYSECDAFVSLSDYYTPILARLIGGDAECKLAAINNPILSDDAFDVCKKRQIVYIGRMEIDTKRADRVLDIWKLLCDKYPDWSLMMVGAGSDKSHLERYAEDLALKNVTFTGRADAMQYFSESWISMLTSSSEGFGLVLVEAQQNGCIPIVYESYAAVHDIIDNGINGYIIPPFDKRKFAAQVAKLIEDVDLRKRLSANCRKSSNRFNLDAIIDQWVELFNRL